MVLVIDIADFKMLKKYFLSFNIYLVEYNNITCILIYYFTLSKIKTCVKQNEIRQSSSYKATPIKGHPSYKATNYIHFNLLFIVHLCSYILTFIFVVSVKIISYFAVGLLKFSFCSAVVAIANIYLLDKELNKLNWERTNFNF